MIDHKLAIPFSIPFSHVGFQLMFFVAAVLKDDVESAKKAFVGAAGALEKWTSLTGLVGELQGL